MGAQPHSHRPAHGDACDSVARSWCARQRFESTDRCRVEMLNTPEFEPPAPAPVRVVRKHNLPGAIEPAHVLTDVLETKERTYLRPLIVGFQNRHNVLWDLERGEISKWWIGDTARELTRGKSWYWELGGQPLGAKLESLVRFALTDPAGQTWQPQATEQFVVDFDALEHTASGVRIAGRMYFSQGERRQTVPLKVSMEPASSEGQSSIQLSFTFEPPAGYRVLVTPGNETSRIERSPAGPRWIVDDRTSIDFGDWSPRYSEKDGQVSVASPSAVGHYQLSRQLRSRSLAPSAWSPVGH